MQSVSNFMEMYVVGLRASTQDPLGEGAALGTVCPRSSLKETCVPLLLLRVDLWNASNLKFGDEFLGELRVPLQVLRQSSSHKAW